MNSKIKYWLIRRILKYGSFLLKLYDHRGIFKHRPLNPSTIAPVFIIGPPRSGSTILYQLITQYLDVLYIDNLINMSRKATFFGFWLSDKIFKNQAHNSFQSNLGGTLESGLHAPNEGLFWYRWLPKNRHYTNKDELSEKSIQQIQNLIGALTNRYKKPIVFKNLSFSVRLKLIKKIFPNSKIIYIKRNPLFVAQSIYKAKQKAHINENEIWSIKPKEYQKLIGLKVEEQVIKQTYMICQHIHDDLILFKKNQILEIDYETLDDTKMILEQIEKFVDCQPSSHNDLIKISARNKQLLSDRIFADLKIEADQLDWAKFTTKI